jgi:RimJ/RimL family protein N-acetyltransferase
MTDVIKTKRLVLRVARPEDAAALARAINHHDVAKYILCPYPYDLGDAESFIASNRKKSNPAYSLFKEGTLIGGVELNDEMELGYWITPEQWGKGYVTEASKAVLARHFEQADAPEVSSGYQPSNLGSATVQVKLGFRVVSHTTESSQIWGEYSHENTILTREDWMHVLSPQS